MATSPKNAGGSNSLISGQLFYGTGPTAHNAGSNGAMGDSSLGTAVGSLRHQMHLRLDRPIEGCELAPRAYVYSTQRTATGIANKAYNQSDHTFEFTWLRGPHRQACANPTCPRADSFSPLEWSAYALQGCRIQCMMCSKLKVPRHRSTFCNARCFKQAWREHQASHAELLKQLAESGAYGEGVRGHDLPDEWGLGGDHDQWELIHGDSRLVPKQDDVGHCLRLECKAVLPDGSLVCPPRALVTEPVLCLPPPLPKRALITYTKSTLGGGVRFRLVSYNLLAEIYATQQAYPHCDFWALHWAYRRTNLFREIVDAQGDILCLQEVQADAFQDFFQPLLSEKGYEGHYKSKTRESMGLMGKVDGCALFWRRNKFRLSENYAIEFNECARRAATAMGLTPDESHQYIHHLSKDNIVQVAVLEVLQRPRTGRMSHSSICVANTHLYSNPDFPDVKLWQCHALLQELEHFVHPRQLPLLLCGDFNSEPTSAVYELLATQGVSPDHSDLANDPYHVLPDPADLTHSIHLQSAYATVQQIEPPYTNYTDMFKGTLDYVWFSAPHLRPLAVAAVPTENEIHRCGRSMPNVQASSDHILLLTDFQLGGLLGVSSGDFSGGGKQYYGS